MSLPSYQSAKDLFEATRQASRELKRIAPRLEILDERRMSLGTLSQERIRTSTQDPNKTQKSITYLDYEALVKKRIKDNEELLNYATSVLYGERAREVSGGVECLLSAKHADVLFIHYVCDLTWEAVDLVHHIPKSTACRMVKEAFDMVDAYGIECVRLGLGIATQ